MNTTKERILKTSLRLFAQSGYDAVSVSQIAGALGITKGALYRHYENKQDILACIIRRMEADDASRAAEYSVLGINATSMQAPHRPPSGT